MLMLHAAMLQLDMAWKLYHGDKQKQVAKARDKVQGTS